MNGLSSGALQNTTSFAAPMQLSSAVSSAVFLIILPMSATASMFMPAFVEPIFMLEQTCSVLASASGMLFMSASSPGAKPF